MGQNSQTVSYLLGQLGSAYTDLAQAIIPPKDHVIVAIQFLAANTPTVLTPEKLDGSGPGFPEITTGSNVTAVNADNTFNHNGIATLLVDDEAGNETVITLTAGANALVRPGQFCLLVNNTYQEDGAPAATIDAQTPIPIYNGPSARGVKVAGVGTAAGLDADQIVLEGHGNTAFVGVSPTTQALIFIDEQHGAGGIIANGQVYPINTTIYGRWTAFTPSDTGACICYFGK